MYKDTELTTVGYQPTIVSKLRSLGSFEELFWLVDQHRPIHFAMAAEIEGETTIEQWRHALNLLQRRHPLLSVSIQKEGNSAPCFIRRPSMPIPLRVVQGIDITRDWELEAEFELSQPFAPETAPLLRAALLHEESRAVCILTVHHSVADGRSMQYVIRDLLQALAGESLETLPLLKSEDELLGIIQSRAGQTEAGEQPDNAYSERPAVYIDKERVRPEIKTLQLSLQLTRGLRDRARSEQTTVHGALSAAIAMAYYETRVKSRPGQIRVMSPIDLRKLLGLEDYCALLVGAGKVAIDPLTAGPFWKIARQATSELAPFQMPEAIIASKKQMRGVIQQGLDVASAAETAAKLFAHEVMVSNLGNFPCETDFGWYRLNAVWGPAVSARIEGAEPIGVATTNGKLSLVQTTFSPNDPLLEVAEDILLSACDS
ncbi:MAG: hypothetical protein JO308_08545 [Verrucomicrobia bacterium]|nr:hypothetical protein [Verrucomicrobiota bacterium]